MIVVAFTEKFSDFVCVGDTISCVVDGYTVTARIEQDECSDAPDQRQDGFWPSLDIGDAGFIGPGNGFRDRFAKAQAKAEAVMAAWRNDEWFYCGIVLTVSVDDIVLDAHAASLWGIEANYPDADNSYLTEIADELLSEAIETAREKQARICVVLCPRNQTDSDRYSLEVLS